MVLVPVRAFFETNSGEIMNKIFGFIAVTILCTGMAFGQVTTGTLVGIVRDPSGASIPNAPVVATNVATGVTYAGKTNGNGEYRIQYLPSGNYSVKAAAPGFNSETLNDVQIQSNLDATGDLKLSIGNTVSVDVSSEASVSIDTTTAQIGSTFVAKETQDLPTATVGLGVLNLSLLVPGVSSSGGIGAGTGPSVGGQRPRNNNFEIEGIDNNSKVVTGPLLYTPNDAVGEFSLLQNVFGAQYGHSTGGQFNQLIVSGTNTLHGRLYEYFDNRNLNAVDTIQANDNRGNGVSPNFQPRYDFNRYGGQLGGAILKDKLFLFSNFERQTTGQGGSGSTYCSPTAAGIATLKSLSFASSNNLGVFTKYSPVALTQAGADDAFCPSTIAVTDTAGTTTNIPVGDFSVAIPAYFNSYYSTSSGDYIISAKDSVHIRYVYNRSDALDTAATLPVFFISAPNRYHLASINETHLFSPNLSNDFRLGFNRYYNQTPVNSASFPGLSQFPNLTFDELNYFNLGPDGNAPQGTIENMYQGIDSLTWVKGKNTFIFGGEGRKYISPQVFVQRARGDYEYANLSSYLNDLSPDVFGQRNALGAIGTPTYYGDQTAFYGYVNDDFRMFPNLTLNLGLRYEFTSIPAGEKLQALNAAASVAGLITFGKPAPQYKNFAPRIGFAFAPDANTSIRGGFGMGYDVLYDNIGTTEAPPQFQSTENVDTSAAQTPNFLGSGGLPATFTFSTVAQQRAATTAYVPNQQLPYAENWTLGIEHVFHHDYTAEVRYVGTRGIHLDVQDRINIQTPLTTATELPTAFGGSTSVTANGSTQAGLRTLSDYVPAYAAGGFDAQPVVADEPYGHSSYNGLATQITRRFQHGLLINAAYTWSKTMDNATADFNTTALNPRRPQDFQNINGDYSLSALSRKHRLTVVAVYDLPFFKASNWYLKNLLGNWEISPAYQFQSPQFTTVQSAIDSNLNGDSATDRVFINGSGVKGTGSGVVPIINSNTVCGTGLSSTPNALLNGTQTLSRSCTKAIIGYAEGAIASGAFVASNAYYVQGGLGTLPTASRDTLPTGRTNDLDASAFKRFAVYKDRVKVEFGVQAFNVLNHPQWLPGSLNQVNSIGSTGDRSFVTVNGPSFNDKQAVFSSNPRSMQLSGKIIF
jgi:hypothetical protein